MPLRSAHVIGSGPNGLAAAIRLAQAGVDVTVFERNAHVGGACSTGELTLPGFLHDLGSSAYPLGIASPFFRTLPLERFGLEWVQPAAAVAHPLDDAPALTLEHAPHATAAQLGPHDGRHYQLLIAPGVRDWGRVVDDATRGLLRWPRHPGAMACFGSVAALPARTLARAVFHGERARALFAGCAAHSVIPLTNLASTATGLLLMTAGHTTGWPVVRGGGGRLSAVLAAYFESLGGRIVLNAEVYSLDDLPPADVTLFDTSVEALVRLAGGRLTPSFRTRLRHARYGPGIFKIDYALREPIPWHDAACLRAATVHVGGTLDEITASEHDAFEGRLHDRPFVLVVQPSLFDSSRAPAAADGRPQHTAWAYCHVPFGSTTDRTAVIESQIERFAPGFRDCVLERRTWSPSSLAAWNPNLVGGDISSGAMTLAGMVARPTLRGHRTSNPRLYLASAAAPPGGGVHGMCGFLAAEAALRDHP